MIRQSEALSAKKAKKTLSINYLLSALIVVVILLLYLGSGMLNWTHRMEQARQTLGVIAANTRKHGQLLFQTLSRDLDEALGIQENFSIGSPDLNQALIQLRDGRSYIRNLSLLDEQGIMRNTTRIPPQGVGQDFSFRDYFHLAPEDPGEPAYLSPVIQSRIDASYGVPFSRAFERGGQRYVLNILIDARFLLPEVDPLQANSFKAAIFNQDNRPVLVYPWEANREEFQSIPYPFDELWPEGNGEGPVSEGLLEGPVYLEGHPFYWYFFLSTEKMFEVFVLDYLGVFPFVLLIMALVAWLNYRGVRRILWEWKMLLEQFKQTSLQKRLRKDLYHRISAGTELLGELILLRDQETKGCSKLVSVWLKGLMAAHKAYEVEGHKPGVVLGKFVENIRVNWEVHDEAYLGSLDLKTSAPFLILSPGVASILGLLIMDILFSFSYNEGSIEMGVIYLESVQTLNLHFSSLKVEEPFDPPATIKKLLSLMRGGYYFDGELQQIHIRLPLGMNI